jgi:hypothetical protein
MIRIVLDWDALICEAVSNPREGLVGRRGTGPAASLREA